jgi:DNA-directed RNA polymerase specialized sigma24 family protein
MRTVPDATAARYGFQAPEMEREILLRRLVGYTRAEIAHSIQMQPWEVQKYENRAINQLSKRDGLTLRRAA